MGGVQTNEIHIQFLAHEIAFDRWYLPEAFSMIDFFFAFTDESQIM